MTFLISAIVIVSAVAAFVLIKKQPKTIVEQPSTPTVVEAEVEAEVEPVAEAEPVATVEEVEPTEPVADLQEVKVEPKKKKTTTKPVKKDK